MALTNCTLGQLVELCTNNNTELSYGIKDVRGVNNEKQLMRTKADLNGRDLSKFQIVYPGDFVFNHRTSRNGSKFSIAYNDGNFPIICTEDYVVFHIHKNSQNILNARWLYMYFNRPEFDRFVITNSWGSSTEFYNWEDIQAIQLNLPDIEIQKKYAAVYNSLLANQKSYEEGLDDLKLTCDAYIEELRRKMPCKAIGPYIEPVSGSNSNGKFVQVQGVDSNGSFIDTRANMQGVDITNYTVVKKGNIAFNPSRINIGSIAIYTEDTPCVVSPMYSVFKVTSIDKVLPEYLMLWFGRTEFQRYTWYYASGSVRDIFGFNDLCDVEIPLPDISMQQNIVNIYRIYNERKNINAQLKSQLKTICPILIKGSLDEGEGC